jgi:predicted amidohydrolase YtcJ
LELVFALAALADAANPEAGFDRIEHGSVVNDEMALRLASLGMPVITQPGFMYTKGDRYLADLTGSELSDLYRFRGLQDRGVPVIASSDAPYGPVSPWQIISTAANRQTLDGVVVGPTERVSTEQALAGYLTPTSALNRPLSFAEAKQVVAGMPADLCILQGKWSEVRGKAENAMVRATLIGGSAAFDRRRSEP